MSSLTNYNYYSKTMNGNSTGSGSYPDPITAVNAIIGIVGSNGGSIKCNVIDGLNDSAMTNICTLFNNEVAGVIYIGCANTTLMYIGYNTNANKTLYIGAYASNIYLGGFKFFHNDMNLLDDTLDMNIANNQSTGNLNIGTKPNRFGKISIGNDDNINEIGAIKMSSNNIELKNGGDMTIGGEILSSNYLNLGNANNKNRIGGLKIEGETLDALASTNFLTLGDVNTLGIYIAGYATAINMGTYTTNTTIYGTRLFTYNGMQGHSLTQTAGVATHNFASCATKYNVNDAQIISTGGTSGSTNTGTLEIKAGTINLTSKGNVNITSSTGSTYVIGPNNCNLEISNGGGNSYLDFHSCATSGNDRDARIICSGGTVGMTDSGNMGYRAGMHTFGSDLSSGGAVKFSGGYLFSKGNMNQVGMYQQYGIYNNPSFGLGPNLSWTTPVITFTTAFSNATPQIFPTLTSTGAMPSSIQALIVSVSNVSNSGFTLTFFNAGTGTTSGACNVNWFAIGQW